MSKRPPRNLIEVMTRAEGLFWSQKGLSILQAVAETLRRLEPHSLEKIYREANEEWCVTALRQGGQARITLGMEVLGSRLRDNNRRIRDIDDERGRDPEAVARGKLHQRRQGWRNRGGTPPRKNPPRSR